MSCLIIIINKWITRHNIKNWNKTNFLSYQKIIIIIILLPGNSLNTSYTLIHLTLTIIVLGIIYYYQFHLTMLEIGLELGISSIYHALKRAEYPKYMMRVLKASKVNLISHSFFCNFWGNFPFIPQFIQILAKRIFYST